MSNSRSLSPRVSVPGSALEALEDRRLFAATPTAGITGEYFSGADFSTPIIVKTDPKIALSVAGGGPDRDFRVGVFGAFWSGTITAPTTGTYTFYTKSDSGTRLSINGITLIDDLVARTASTQQGTIALTAGQAVPIAMNYVSRGTGQAVAKLLWSDGTTAPRVVPTSAFAPDATPPTLPTTEPLTGTYYLGTQFETQIMSRDDKVIDFNWGRGTPDPVVPDHTAFSVIWSGTIVPAYSETYTFTSVTDDGVRLFVGGSPVINKYETMSATANSGKILLQAGVAYPIQMQYDQNGKGHASAKLFWQSASQAKELVPFSSAVPAAVTDLSATVASDTEIDLNWTAVAGATGYTVLRSTSPTGPFTQIGATDGSTTSFADGGLTPNTPYYFQVIATNAAGSSPASNIATGTTTVATPSFANLTVTYGLTNGADVYSIDTAAGSTQGNVTRIGTLAFGTAAAGRDPVSGYFYYVEQLTDTPRIATWNPATGVNTTINPGVTLGSNVSRAAFASDGTFYFTDGTGGLYAVDRTTGVATPRGTLFLNGAALIPADGDMAFAPDGTLFVYTGGALYSTPASDVAAGGTIPLTQIGAGRNTNLQIAFGRDGTLFGEDTTVGQLYTVNYSTGVTTAVGTPSGIPMGDLASVPLFADVAVSQSTTNFAAGATAQVLVNVINNGPNATRGPLTLVETLDPNETFVSAKGAGWAFDVNGQTVTATYSPFVAAGASVPTVTINVQISTSATGSLTNTATVSTTVFDTDAANNLNTQLTAL